MKRLHYVNLIGVLAVAALCIVQWRMNRQLNLEVRQLDRIRQEQEWKLLEQEHATKGISSDLEVFRSQFERADAETKEAARKLAAVERLVAQLERERDQLKQSVTNWAAAVAERDERYARETAQLRQSVTNWAGAVAQRDERLKEANTRLRELGNELNARTAKFNELATNYNATVQRLNELTSNYNAVVKQLNEARGAK
jgi:chromosome segregation ATPase